LTRAINSLAGQNTFENIVCFREWLGHISVIAVLTPPIPVPLESDWTGLSDAVIHQAFYTTSIISYFLFFLELFGLYVANLSYKLKRESPVLQLQGLIRANFEAKA
jgi:hypothetical protein